MLETYFNHLSEKTGAQEFKIVRDDHSLERELHRKDSCAMTRTRSWHPASSDAMANHRPEVEQIQPPCPPKRVESAENMLDALENQKRSERWMASATAAQARNRLNELFAEERSRQPNIPITHEATNISPLKLQPKKKLSGIGAPKFPMRKGSHDDLFTLKATQRRRRNEDEKVEISSFLDEVGIVLSEIPTFKSRRSVDSLDETSTQNAKWFPDETTSVSLDRLPSYH